MHNQISWASLSRLPHTTNYNSLTIVYYYFGTVSSSTIDQYFTAMSQFFIKKKKKKGTVRPTSPYYCENPSERYIKFSIHVSPASSPPSLLLTLHLHYFFSLQRHSSSRDQNPWKYHREPMRWRSDPVNEKLGCQEHIFSYIGRCWHSI